MQFNWAEGWNPVMNPRRRGCAVECAGEADGVSGSTGWRHLVD